MAVDQIRISTILAHITQANCQLTCTVPAIKAVRERSHANKSNMSKLHIHTLHNRWNTSAFDWAIVLSGFNNFISSQALDAQAYCVCPGAGPKLDDRPQLQPPRSFGPQPQPIHVCAMPYMLVGPSECEENYQKAKLHQELDIWAA